MSTQTMDARRRYMLRRLAQNHTPAPTVTAGCMDCDMQSLHRTVTAARDALEAHSFDAPGHRALVATVGNGWHRAFGEWLADGPRISGGALAATS